MAIFTQMQIIINVGQSQVMKPLFLDLSSFLLCGSKYCSKIGVKLIFIQKQVLMAINAMNWIREMPSLENITLMEMTDRRNRRLLNYLLL